jgi:CBS domain-containing protein
MRLAEIMRHPVETILPSASPAEARAAMNRARINHLVVVRSGRQIVGVVCAHDLHGAAPGSTVEDLMSSPAVTASAGTNVRDAAKLLRGRSIGSLVVVERGRPAGMVTTSDLLGLLGRGTLQLQPTTRRWTLARRGPTHRPEPRHT